MRVRTRGSVSQACAGRELVLFQQIEDLLARLEGRKEAAPAEASHPSRGQNVDPMTPDDVQAQTVPPPVEHRKR